MAIKTLSILSILILLSSFPSYSKEGIRNSCEINIQSRAKDPKALNEICDCVAKSTGLAEYNGFASLNDLLKRYDEMFFMSEDSKIHLPSPKKSLRNYS